MTLVARVCLKQNTIDWIKGSSSVDPKSCFFLSSTSLVVLFISDECFPLVLSLPFLEEFVRLSSSTSSSFVMTSLFGYESGMIPLFMCCTTAGTHSESKDTTHSATSWLWSWRRSVNVIFGRAEEEDDDDELLELVESLF